MRMCYPIRKIHKDEPSRLLTHRIAKTIPIGFLLRKHIFGFYYKLDLWYNSTDEKKQKRIG